jgi:hypothetical protein
MKFEITTCCQCGNAFKRTNRRQSYCSTACRVSAHRDRHGYEQPIFTYPTIRAIDNIKKIDVSDLYNIKLLAVHYLLEKQEKGDSIPDDTQLKLLKVIAQLKMASDDEKMKVALKVVEPFSELLQLVQKIQKDEKRTIESRVIQNTTN